MAQQEAQDMLLLQLEARRVLLEMERGPIRKARDLAARTTVAAAAAQAKAQAEAAARVREHGPDGGFERAGAEEQEAKEATWAAMFSVYLETLIHALEEEGGQGEDSESEGEEEEGPGHVGDEDDDAIVVQADSGAEGEEEPGSSKKGSLQERSRSEIRRLRITNEALSLSGRKGKGQRKNSAAHSARSSRILAGLGLSMSRSPYHARSSSMGEGLPPLAGAASRGGYSLKSPSPPPTSGGTPGTTPLSSTPSRRLSRSLSSSRGLQCPDYETLRQHFAQAAELSERLEDKEHLEEVFVAGLAVWLCFWERWGDPPPPWLDPDDPLHPSLNPPPEGKTAPAPGGLLVLEGGREEKTAFAPQSQLLTKRAEEGVGGTIPKLLEQKSSSPTADSSVQDAKHMPASQTGEPLSSERREGEWHSTKVTGTMTRVYLAPLAASPSPSPSPSPSAGPSPNPSPRVTANPDLPAGSPASSVSATGLENERGVHQQLLQSGFCSSSIPRDKGSAESLTLPSPFPRDKGATTGATPPFWHPAYKDTGAGEEASGRGQVMSGPAEGGLPLGAGGNDSGASPSGGVGATVGKGDRDIFNEGESGRESTLLLQNSIVADALSTEHLLLGRCHHDDILLFLGVAAALAPLQPATAAMVLLRLIDRISFFEVRRASRQLSAVASRPVTPPRSIVGSSNPLLLTPQHPGHTGAASQPPSRSFSFSPSRAPPGLTTSPGLNGDRSQGPDFAGAFSLQVCREFAQDCLVAVFECSAARAAAAAEAAAAAAAEMAAAELAAAGAAARPPTPQMPSPRGEWSDSEGVPAMRPGPLARTASGLKRVWLNSPRASVSILPSPKGRGAAAEGRPIWNRASSLGPRAARRPTPLGPSKGPHAPGMPLPEAKLSPSDGEAGSEGTAESTSSLAVSGGPSPMKPAPGRLSPAGMPLGRVLAMRSATISRGGCFSVRSTSVAMPHSGSVSGGTPSFNPLGVGMGSSTGAHVSFKSVSNATPAGGQRRPLGRTLSAVQDFQALQGAQAQAHTHANARERFAIWEAAKGKTPAPGATAGEARERVPAGGPSGPGAAVPAVKPAPGWEPLRLSELAEIALAEGLSAARHADLMERCEELDRLYYSLGLGPGLLASVLVAEMRGLPHLGPSDILCLAQSCAKLDLTEAAYQGGLRAVATGRLDDAGFDIVIRFVFSRRGAEGPTSRFSRLAATVKGAQFSATVLLQQQQQEQARAARASLANASASGAGKGSKFGRGPRRPYITKGRDRDRDKEKDKAASSKGAGGADSGPKQPQQGSDAPGSWDVYGFAQQLVQDEGGTGGTSGGGMIKRALTSTISASSRLFSTKGATAHTPPPPPAPQLQKGQAPGQGQAQAQAQQGSLVGAGGSPGGGSPGAQALAVQGVAAMATSYVARFVDAMLRSAEMRKDHPWAYEVLLNFLRINNRDGAMDEREHRLCAQVRRRRQPVVWLSAHLRFFDLPWIIL